MSKPKLIIASTYAAVLAIIFITLITVWAELSAPLKDWLKAFSGHHWISKSIFSVLIYIIGSAALYKVVREPNDISLRKALNLLLMSVIFGVVILMAFYTGHHFGFF